MSPPSRTPSRPSTRPSDARGRRSSTFVREDSERAAGSALLVDQRQSGDVGASRRVRAHPGDDDPPERVVGLPVTPPGGPVPGPLARRRGDRGGGAPGRPTPFPPPA